MQKRPRKSVHEELLIENNTLRFAAHRLEHTSRNIANQQSFALLSAELLRI